MNVVCPFLLRASLWVQRSHSPSILYGTSAQSPTPGAHSTVQHVTGVARTQYMACTTGHMDGHSSTCASRSFPWILV